MFVIPRQVIAFLAQTVTFYMHAIIVTGCSRYLRMVAVSHLNFTASLRQKLQFFKCVYSVIHIVFHPCSGNCSINIFSISCNKSCHGLFALSSRYCVTYIPQHFLVFPDTPGQVCGQICHSTDGPKIFLMQLHCQTRERIWLLVLPVYAVAFLHDLTCVLTVE